MGLGRLSCTPKLTHVLEPVNGMPGAVHCAIAPSNEDVGESQSQTVIGMPFVVSANKADGGAGPLYLHDGHNGLASLTVVRVWHHRVA